MLRDNHALVAEETITHSYAHCWRTKTPLIYRATPQWFISMTEKDLLGLALKAVDGIKWIPDWGQARIQLMLKGSPDWCVSRQRSWGSPITLFVNKETQELHPRTAELLEEVALRIERKGIDAWFDLNPEELIGEEASDYTKVTDTLDVWFDSGVSHAAVLECDPSQAWPADLYLEGSDQHRGWFHSSLLESIGTRAKAPYKAALTHGYVVDGKGKKMSKSAGNVIAPQKIIDQYGAEILRLWVASENYREDIRVSQEILKRLTEAYRKIRNTFRYLLGNLYDFDLASDSVPAEDLLEICLLYTSDAADE